MEVKVYQIKNFDTCDYFFRDYEKAKKYGFTMDDYVEVYNMLYVHIPSEENNYRVLMTEEDKLDLLEKIFEESNITGIKDFPGHTISMSDVISLDNDYYYCDRCGWTKI